MVYKFGFTKHPAVRFRNRTYGYAFDPHQQWQAMVVIFASHESTGPAFLESALVQKYKGLLFEGKHYFYVLFNPLFLHSDMVSFLGWCLVWGLDCLSPQRLVSKVHQAVGTNVMEEIL